MKRKMTDSPMDAMDEAFEAFEASADAVKPEREKKWILRCLKCTISSEA